MKKWLRLLLEQNQKIDDAVESQSAILKGVWDSGKSPDTMSFVDLSAAAKREVFFTVRQYFDAQLDQSLSPEAALEQVTRRNRTDRNNVTYSGREQYQ